MVKSLSNRFKIDPERLRTARINNLEASEAQAILSIIYDAVNQSYTQLAVSDIPTEQQKEFLLAHSISQCYHLSWLKDFCTAKCAIYAAKNGNRAEQIADFLTRRKSKLDENPEQTEDMQNFAEGGSQ